MKKRENNLIYVFVIVGILFIPLAIAQPIVEDSINKEMVVDCEDCQQETQQAITFEVKEAPNTLMKWIVTLGVVIIGLVILLIVLKRTEKKKGQSKSAKQT